MLRRGHKGIACDFIGHGHRDNAEPHANRFAASALLTQQEFISYLRQEGLAGDREWSDKALRDLAKRFFVSRDVVAITLEQLGLAPRGFYREKRTQWIQQYGKQSPFARGKNPKKWERKADELGRSAVSLIARLRDNDSLPLLDVAEFLDTKVERLDQFIERFRTTSRGA